MSLLNEQELKCLMGLLSGKCNRELGVLMHVSTSMIKVYLGSIYAKLGVSNRVGAALKGFMIFKEIIKEDDIIRANRENYIKNKERIAKLIDIDLYLNDQSSNR